MMNSIQHWNVDVVLCDTDDNVNAYEVRSSVHAQATLIADGRVFRGSGQARLAPETVGLEPDPVPGHREIAHEIAAARALSAVVQQVLDAALSDIQDLAVLDSARALDS